MDLPFIHLSLVVVASALWIPDELRLFDWRLKVSLRRRRRITPLVWRGRRRRNDLAIRVVGRRSWQHAHWIQWVFRVIIFLVREW